MHLGYLLFLSPIILAIPVPLNTVTATLDTRRGRRNVASDSPLAFVHVGFAGAHRAPIPLSSPDLRHEKTNATDKPVVPPHGPEKEKEHLERGARTFCCVNEFRTSVMTHAGEGFDPTSTRYITAAHTNSKRAAPSRANNLLSHVGAAGPPQPPPPPPLPTPTLATQVIITVTPTLHRLWSHSLLTEQKATRPNSTRPQDIE
jgi:hypothetical protein